MGSDTRSMTKPPDPPQPPSRPRVDGLRVTLAPEPIVAPAPIVAPGTPEPTQLAPEMFAGRDLEFEAECARLQELDDLADWEAAQPWSNVIPFDLLRAKRPPK